MTFHTSVTLVRAASLQEAALKAIIEADALANFHDIAKGDLAAIVANVCLLTHAEVGEMVPASDLLQGLEQSPVAISGDGVVSLLTGANDVASHLSSELSMLLHDDATATLQVPHAYATQAEIDSLVARNHIPMRVQADQVYYCFDAMNCESELIRKSLGSTIAMHSVAWVFSGAGHNKKPALALVPIFDGDGWALAGSFSTIFPTIHPSMH